MNLEEKQAIQTVLLDEVYQHQKDNPTMLIDALLSGQGYQFIYSILQRRGVQAAQLAQVHQQLVTALRTLEAVPLDPEERVA